VQVGAVSSRTLNPKIPLWTRWGVVVVAG